MKTPKEILLQRHQGIELKLNAARHRALEALARPRWREFVWSLRWHLAGMSAVWLVVLVLNTDSNSSAVVAANDAPPARALMASLLQNRRELMEMMGTASPAEPPKLQPGRSEIEPKAIYV